MALHRSVLIACLVGLVLPACKQSEDEACQVNTDCDDGLVCSIADNALRGACLPPDQLPQEIEDAGNGDGGDTVPEDAAIPMDSGEDAAADDDAG